MVHGVSFGRPEGFGVKEVDVDSDCCGWSVLTTLRLRVEFGDRVSCHERSSVPDTIVEIGKIKEKVSLSRLRLSRTGSVSRSLSVSTLT